MKRFAAGSMIHSFIHLFILSRNFFLYFMEYIIFQEVFKTESLSESARVTDESYADEYRGPYASPRNFSVPREPHSAPREPYSVPREPYSASRAPYHTPREPYTALPLDTREPTYPTPTLQARNQLKNYRGGKG